MSFINLVWFGNIWRFPFFTFVAMGWKCLELQLWRLELHGDNLTFNWRACWYISKLTFGTNLSAKVDMRRMFEFSLKYQVYKDLVKKGGILKLIGFSPPISVPSRGSAITFIGRRQKGRKGQKHFAGSGKEGPAGLKLMGWPPPNLVSGINYQPPPCRRPPPCFFKSLPHSKGGEAQRSTYTWCKWAPGTWQGTTWYPVSDRVRDITFKDASLTIEIMSK